MTKAQLDRGLVENQDGMPGFEEPIEPLAGSGDPTSSHGGVTGEGIARDINGCVPFFGGCNFCGKTHHFSVLFQKDIPREVRQAALLVRYYGFIMFCRRLLEVGAYTRAVNIRVEALCVWTGGLELM